MNRKDATEPPFNRRRDDPWHERIIKYVDDRHTENADRFDRLEGRVGVLEHQGEAMRVELVTNTAITQAVKTDTSALVAATKMARAVRAGISGMGKLALLASPVVAAACAVASAVIAYFMWVKK